MTSEIRANTLKNRVGLGTVSFTNTGPVVSGIVTIANSTAAGVTLEDNAGVGNSLKITTPTGYVSIGSGNSTFVHLQTDRGVFYFQKRIFVDEGIIGSYDENLILQSPSNTTRITINKDTGLVSIVNDLDVDGHTNLDNVSVAGVSTFSSNITLPNNISMFFGDGGTKIFGTAGGGASNGLRFFTDSGGSLFIDGNHNVYVQQGNLSVTGTISATSTVYIPDAIEHSGDSNTKIRFPAADTFSVETAGSERLRITSNGRVGIGSDIPENKLKINVTSGNDGVVVQNTSTANIALIGARNGDATLQIGQYGSTASGNVFGIAAANLAFMYTTSYASTHPSALLIGNSSNKDIIFATNATERLRITSAGVVQVGKDNQSSTTFTQNLDIRGRYVNAVGDFSRLMFRNSTDSGNSSASIRAQRTGDNYGTELSFFTQASGGGSGGDGLERLRIKSDGTVRIGGDLYTDTDIMMTLRNRAGTASQIQFHGTGTGNGTSDGLRVGYNGTGGQMWLFENGGYIRFATSNNERVRIGEYGEITHTRGDNTTRWDVEFRQTGGISDGNYGGIKWTQNSTGGVHLAGMKLAYANTGRPDLVFSQRNRGGGTGEQEIFRLDSDGEIIKTRATTRYVNSSVKSIEFPVYFSSGTTYTVVTLGGSYDTGFVAFATLEYIGLYAYAGTQMSGGVRRAYTRRTNNNTAWRDFDNQVSENYGENYRPDIFWENGVLKVTTPGSTQITGFLRVVAHAGNTATNVQITRNLGV